MICYNYLEYMTFIKFMKQLLKDELKFVIITSENKDIIKNVTNYTSSLAI